MDNPRSSAPQPVPQIPRGRQCNPAKPCDIGGFTTCSGARRQVRENLLASNQNRIRNVSRGKTPHGRCFEVWDVWDPLVSRRSNSNIEFFGHARSCGVAPHMRSAGENERHKQLDSSCAHKQLEAVPQVFRLTQARLQH
jgi:hypothetical protein